MMPAVSKMKLYLPGIALGGVVWLPYTYVLCDALFNPCHCINLGAQCQGNLGGG